MSRDKAQTIEPRPPVEPPKPAPVKVPIKDCIGKLIRCPDCGADALVLPARASTAAKAASSAWWVLVRCKGFCGSKLQKVATLVEPLSKPIPEPERISLNRALGKLVRCPIIDCGEPSRVAIDIDAGGHVIICPVHRSNHYDPTTWVELV